MADACGRQPSAPFQERPAADKALAALCKTLGHPHRVHILRFLSAQDGCIAGEIADQLPIAASTVSRHLSILKDAGLVKGEVDGPRLYSSGRVCRIGSARPLAWSLLCAGSWDRGASGPGRG